MARRGTARICGGSYRSAGVKETLSGVASYPRIAGDRFSETAVGNLSASKDTRAVPPLVGVACRAFPSRAFHCSRSAVLRAQLSRRRGSALRGGGGRNDT